MALPPALTSTASAVYQAGLIALNRAMQQHVVWPSDPRAAADKLEALGRAIYAQASLALDALLKIQPAPPAPAPGRAPAPAPAPISAPAPKTAPVPGASPLLPFDQLPPETLRQYPRKVFAHYFPPYPISIDNRDPGNDYYARNYLNPHGERDKWLHVGGLLRDRPLPRAPLGGDWALEDMKTEVERAQALGIDGFAVDIMTTPSSRDPQQWNRLVKLLEATGASNTSFRIMPMVDVSGGLGTSEAKAAASFQEIMKELIRLEKASGKKRLNTLPDGRLAITVFKAEAFPPRFWQAQFDRLRRETGVNAAFMPCFVKKMSPAELEAYGSMPASFGLSRWGARTPTAASSEEPKQMRQYNSQWMSPVAPQDFRPKEKRFEEAEGSANYRAMWEAAIAGSDEDDWVQLITWNDYSEHTEIAPSVATGHGFYDLTAYYVQWFKTGKPPEIVRDVLYYFHRNQPAAAQPNSALQPSPFRNTHGEARTKDNIEVLGFLKDPGTLAVEINGKRATKAVPAGIQSFKVPVRPGVPRFQLERNGKTAINFASDHKIRASVDTQNFMYHAGSSTR